RRLRTLDREQVHHGQARFALGQAARPDRDAAHTLFLLTKRNARALPGGVLRRGENAEVRRRGNQMRHANADSRAPHRPKLPPRRIGGGKSVNARLSTSREQAAIARKPYGYTRQQS